ncbi:uncharacterized protein [Rutidosis leptorrhynchoides]|uniref:uncharacterized protein n=1 Tax=Rutidosis leptorrhynchoides TaxID=125765 RepID=UPI003A996B31
MAADDEDKTAFHTSQGIYCYTKMLFGLKNAAATYQRVIDEAFKSQISINLEAYVDDLVIKNTTAQSLLDDILETFSSLRKINMKLNPSKCSFGEEEGKFLGHIITERGIRANPKKIEAIESMPSPRSKKEVQSLIEEAEVAFQEMKKLLKELPTMTAPIAGEILILYLEASKEEISLVLIANKGQVLYKPENSGRMAKWAIELGLVLADYLDETAGDIEISHESKEIPPLPEQMWEMHTDGACGLEGAGAGIILKSPEGEEYTFALGFSFPVTNNEAEYEALLSRMHVEKYLEVKELSLVQELAVDFDVFQIMQVSRTLNKKADALSKLAALTFNHFKKEIWVEEVKVKSIDTDCISATDEEEELSWMTPIVEFMNTETLPIDSTEARRIKMKAPMYLLDKGVLYRKSFLGPHLRCLNPTQAESIIREVHEGMSALHLGHKTVASKIMRLGYYWP